jgi:hypothetical protein
MEEKDTKALEQIMMLMRLKGVGPQSELDAGHGILLLAGVQEPAGAGCLRWSDPNPIRQWRQPTGARD